MKKTIVLLVAVTLGLTTALSAKKVPSARQAAKLPGDFKKEITRNIDYPDFAKNHQIEGEVWLRVTMNDEAQVRIVDLSATHPALGEYVQDELSGLTLKKASIKAGDVYFMKVRFDLVEK